MDTNLERDERKSNDRPEASRRDRQSENDDADAEAGDVSENNLGCSSYPPEIFFILLHNNVHLEYQNKGNPSGC